MSNVLRNALAIVGLVAVVLFLGVCAACGDDDDDDEGSWSPASEQIASSERPGGRDGPGRDGEDCDGSCGNKPGNDCNQSENCSDDDQLIFAPTICVEPDSCTWG